MLRITIKTEGEKTRVLYLEGKIIRDYLGELQTEIERGLRRKDNVVLDLARVSFLDEEGARMIRSFSEGALSLRNCSLYIQAALDAHGKEDT
ncbi:MAG: STAS domain-containing protein [Candidatus Aminicenantales bacterium]